MPTGKRLMRREMKIVITYCDFCDEVVLRDAVQTGDSCKRCPRGLLYRVEIDFQGEKV